MAFGAKLQIRFDNKQHIHHTLWHIIILYIGNALHITVNFIRTHNLKWTKISVESDAIL